MLTISLLGAPRVERDGLPVEVDTRKAIALLAYLAVTARAQSRDALANLLWPEYDPEHARAALRRTLSTLRSALPENALDTQRATIALAKGPGVWIDVDEFQRLLAEVESHPHETEEPCSACVRHLTEAIDLYRGDFLEGFGLRDSVNFDDWQVFQAESYRQAFLAAVDRLADALVADGQLERALEHARRRLALDPLHEPAHRRLMQLYAWSGQRGAALHQYRECVRILHRELGVSPLPETTELYRAIAESQVSPRRPAPTARAAATVSQAVAGAEPGARGEYPLVGRDSELATLVDAYDAADRGRVIVVEGEAGIGKTRLVDELVAHARSRDAVALTARCYEDEAGLAYGPIAELVRSAVSAASETGRLGALPAEPLGEATRLLPELVGLRPGLPSPSPLESPGAQIRFFEALSQLLLGACADSVPGIVAVDDVHWADEASLDVVTYLARRIRGRAVCVVLAWRSEAVPAGHRLRRLRDEGRRARAVTAVRLDRLQEADVQQLVHAAAPAVASASPEELSRRLYRLTTGVPLFVVEYLAAAAATNGHGGALPGGVRQLLQARLDAVGQIGRQLLTAAAVIGRSFDFDTVRRASGRSDEETVQALEELLALRLVEEVDEAGRRGPTYDFRHEQLRELVYDDTSLARRRLLHRRVAEALAAGTRGRTEAHALAALVAHHFQRAGLEAEAAEWFRLAGEHARSLFANAEALAHFRTAVALGHPDAAGLYEAIGDVLTLLGDYGEAVASYETAAAQPEASNLSIVEHKLGTVHDRRGDWDVAETHFQAALNALGNGGSASRARLLADRGLTAHHAGDGARALALAEEALALADAAEEASALAHAHNILGILATSRGDLERAEEHLEHSLTYAATVGDPSTRIAALNNLALACRARGDLERALALLEEAVAVCASQGDRHREAALHNNIADVLHETGRGDEAMAHLKRAVAIFAEVGEPGAMQPEIWKLVEW